MALELSKGMKINDRYVLRDLLGQGGFSVVWLAEDTFTDTRVAIKIYAPDKGLDQNGIEQFKKEFRRTRNLNHPHLLVPEHLDILAGSRSPFLIMPYCSGGSLGPMALSKEPVGEQLIARIMAEIGSGLKALHANGVIHQDIKPDNILIHESGKYMLTDFGISRNMRSTLKKATANQSYMTAAYSPPERYSANPVDTPASDIFSLAVMLYELCTGGVPWDGMGGMVLNSGAAVPNLPEAYAERLNAIIGACMDKDHSKRPSAGDLERMGREYQATGSWPAYTGRPATSSRRTQKMEMDMDTGPARAQEADGAATMASGAGSSSAQKPAAPKKSKASLWAAAAIIPLLLAAGFYWYYSGTMTAGNGKGSIIDSSGVAGLNSMDIDTVSAGTKTVATDDTPKKDPPKTTPVETKKTVPAGPTAATLYERGMEAYERSDFSEAAGLFRSSADKGYAPALNALGELYKDGEGVAQNYSTALELFKKAADQGNAAGQYNYGDMYYHGYGVGQNYKTAYSWFSRSVQQSSAPAFAYAHLGDMYYNGYYLSKNTSEALEWYIKGAEKGEPYAQYSAGKMYDEGEGAAENKSIASGWYRKAADQGYAPAQNGLGELYKEGEGFTQDYDTALDLFRKAAAQGDADGQYNYGDMYFHGFGVEQDYAKAFQYIGDSIDNPDGDAPAFAYAHMADIYYYGHNGVENKEAAMIWYKDAAERDEAYGFFRVGNMYQNGETVDEDAAEALNWYREAATRGYAEASNQIGLMYFSGSGITEDRSEAVRWFRMAADDDLPVGQFNLGYMYRYGYGVSKNISTAKYWFQKAAAQGYQNAKDALEELN